LELVHTCVTPASAGISCRRVCLSICLSQVGVSLKWLNAGSRKQRHMIAQKLEFSDAENLGKTQTGSLPTEVSNAGEVDTCRCGSCKLATFDAKRCQLSSVASLSHSATALFVCSTFAVMQRIMRVGQQQLILVIGCRQTNSVKALQRT